MMNNKALAIGASILLLAGIAGFAWNMNSKNCCQSSENTTVGAVENAVPQAIAGVSGKCATACKTDAACCKTGAVQVCTPEEAAAAGCVPCPEGSTPCCTVNGVPYCKE